MRHFLDLTPVGAPALRRILLAAIRRRAARGSLPKGALDADAPLAGRTLALIFEKSSTRTRISFEQAIRQLGGSALVLSANDMQLGRGETIADTARTLSRYVDAIMIRTSAHDKLKELAAAASVPVINGLTNVAHPCQIMADVMAYEDHCGAIAGSQWAWLGDGNNVANTLCEAAGLFGFHLRLGIPAGFDPDPITLATAREQGARIEIVREASAAVAGAQAIVTDTWLSMHQQDDDARRAAMQAFKVTPELMALAHPRAVFLHCLPAHRGEEVTDAVLDGAQSIVWDEAENRLHVQKAILLWCFGMLD